MLDAIRAAANRVEGRVRSTPVRSAFGAHLKCEHLQHTGSFKVRGAMNKVLSLPAEQLARGVVAASTGNHGRAVAYALRQAGTRGTIFLPSMAARRKIDALRAFDNVHLELLDADAGDVETHARDVATRTGRTFISPYNDWDVIAGQGTIGLELVEQCPEMDAVFVAVGGGGLIGGIGSVMKALRADVRVVGCWPENAPALYASLEAGRILAEREYEEKPTLSDATAGGLEPHAVTFELARRVIDERVLVSEATIADAVRLLADAGEAVEGAAGVALAAHLATRERFGFTHPVVVLCGGNVA